MLTLDFEKVASLELNASDVAMRALLAPVLAGKTDFSRLSQIDLEELARRFRMQRIVFEVARDVYDQMRPKREDWKGTSESLLPQLIGLVELFVVSSALRISPALYAQDDLRKRLIITLQMNKVVQHVFEAISFGNTEEVVPVFDTGRPLRSTADMGTWYTRKPRERTSRSHINVCVFDSSWEATEAMHLDENRLVRSWVKNDHLGFEITYTFNGVVKKYRPDFLIRLMNGVTLILEVKGQDTQEARTKRQFLGEWVQAVNDHAGFGPWAWDVSLGLDDLPDILARQAAAQA